MPTLFILDVPEFAPVVRAAEGLRYGVRRKGGYVTIEATDDLVIERAKSGLTDAIWYGVLTGGYAGRVTAFDAKQLRIVAA